MIDEQTLNEYLKNIPLTIPAETAYPSLSNFTNITGIRIGLIEVKWVFGLGFNDHEDNFVTLFNKNFSQQILSQFE